MRLLPRNREVAWTPYVWLVFLGYIFINPILNYARFRAGAKVWIAPVAVTAVFLALYFRSYWLTGTARLRMIAGIALLGLAYMPFNAGATVFIVYAAALVPFAAGTRLAMIAIGAILATIAAENFLLRSLLLFWIPLISWMPSAVFALAIGAVNIHFAQTQRANQRLRTAQEEIERLARVAERERIARDLHDVLGHTLSVVVLKSELASKVIGQDPERAGGEIREVERIAREALAEVRQAIGGYRAVGLEEELARAEATLRTAGVRAERLSERVVLSAAQETVLALAVREAVTNVVRHADARRCVLSLGRENDCCRLEIADDGRAGAQAEGNGVRGMRERVEALGGTLGRDTSAGTRLTIRLPLGERA